MKTSFEEIQKVQQGTDDLVITDIVWGDASVFDLPDATRRSPSGGYPGTRRSGDVTYRVQFSAVFEDEATARASPAGSGNSSVVEDAFATAFNDTASPFNTVAGVSKGVTAPTEPATIKRVSRANEVILRNVVAFPMFSVVAYTDTFVHGFALHDCVSEVTSIEDLRQYKYELGVGRGDTYVTRRMRPQYSNVWSPYNPFLSHPSTDSLGNPVPCIDPILVEDIYGKSGPSGSFLVTTTEAHLFAPLVSSWKPFAEIAQVVACLTPAKPPWGNSK